MPTILAIHDEQLAEHGGHSGVRDLALLESALARPLNRAAYGEGDAFDLAAAYAFGIARNHPFFDGNKRTGYVAAELFLMKNGYVLESTDVASVLAMLQLAEGTMTEEAFAKWLRENSTPFKDER
ncbi:MAG: type II toxin-antitoxin system death-on-curing family toxin [Stellaceae bacterium]